MVVVAVAVVATGRAAAAAVVVVVVVVLVSWAGDCSTCADVSWWAAARERRLSG
jgi:hypothetical protein